MNAIKTTTLRIRSAKAELEAAGEEVDEYCESSAKMREEILALSGVDIMESDGETFRSTYDILLDISNIWSELEDVSKANLLEILAGKRNATVVKSIITNVDDLTGAYEDAQNATGTLAEANSIYLDTIEGKQEQFTAAWEEFADGVMNSDLIKGAVDAGSGLLGFLNQLNESPILTKTNSGIFQILSSAAISGLMGTDKGEPKRRVSWITPIYIKDIA